MNKEEFSKKLRQQLNEIQIFITEDKIEKFYLYMQNLVEWNKKINLTAIVEPEEIITKHFVDSLTILPQIPQNSKVIDVGTGAGFPGIPLKIMREDIEILLLDSLNKRINFLNEEISQLELKKIQTIHSRAEDAGKSLLYRECFDIATSRAVANMRTLAEYLLPFVKIGGKVIFMKGNNITEELETAQKAITTLGGKIKEVKEIILPQSNIKRNILLIDKKNATPKQYPRGQGKPSQKPI